MTDYLPFQEEPETSIEIMPNESRATVFSCNAEMVTRLFELAQTFPNQVEIVDNFYDISLTVTCPSSWIAICAPDQPDQQLYQRINEYSRNSHVDWEER